MIRNLQHASAVQKRRVAAGKKGLAKAIRRWMRRLGIDEKALV